MSIAEQELIRNFCPKCIIQDKNPNALYCRKCGNSDLIPKPESIIELKARSEGFSIEDNLLTTEESDLVIGTIPLQALSEEKLIPQIDIEIVEKLKQPFAFITGRAGSGKTSLVRLMAELDPNYIELTSTTGIAAVNLGGRTINSVLKYYNTKSLEQNYQNGKLQWGLRKIRAYKRNLGIEEVSMLDAKQLDLICAAVDEINNDTTGKILGIHLVGDCCQLPPVNAEFCFKSQYWDRFEKNTIKLTKIWRQDNLDFVKAMNYARAGDGNSCVAQLIDCGVRFTNKLDNEFDGTTLIAINLGVDDYNEKRLRNLKTPLIRTTPRKQGLQLKEWNNLVPTEFRSKIDAYVMILANDVPNLTYANGDAGYIENYDNETDRFEIRLARNNKIVKIGRVMRENLSENWPVNSNFTGFTPYLARNSPGDWVVGNVSYHPLRLGWASSIHKCLHDEAIVKDRERGFIPLKHIRENDFIWNGNKFLRVMAVNKSMQLGIEILTDSSKTIASLEHRFPTNWHNQYLIQVKDFKIGQELLDGNKIISGGYVAIKGLRAVGNISMVDIELEDSLDSLSHLFWADGIMTHNSQGLSLDRVQIDTRANFFSAPSMGYVSLSRARTPEGLIIVGRPQDMAKKIRTSDEVKKWI